MKWIIVKRLALPFQSNDRGGQLAMNSQKMMDADRQHALSFFSGSSRIMLDEMNANLSDVQATEKTAISDYEGLMVARKKEVDAP